MDIILANIRGEVSLAPDAGAEQLRILAALNCVQVVSNNAEQDVAVLAIQQHALDVISAVETIGDGLRKPAREYAAKIMKLEKEFLAPIKDEKKRITETLIGPFQEREQIRLRREELSRLEEIRQLQAKQADLEREATAVESAIPADNVSEDGILDPDAANRALALREQAEDVEVETLAVAMLDKPEASKSQGLAVGKVWKWAFTNMEQAYAAHPEFFKLEEKKAVIKGCLHEGFTCPGMRTWQEIDPRIRRQ